MVSSSIAAGVLRLVALIALALAGVLRPAVAANESRRVSIELIAERTSIGPGEELWVALKETIAPGWHTYWINPGDSGEPTTITWQLPPGFTASEIHWPLPEAIRVGPLTNFGYSDKVLLLTRIKAPASLPPGPLTLTAEAQWLVCKDICIPESGTASLALRAGAGAGSGTAGGPAAREIADALRQVPQTSPWVARVSARGSTLELVAEGVGPLPAERLAQTRVAVLPLQWGVIKHAGHHPTRWQGNDLVVTLERGDLSNALPKELDAVLAIEERTGSGVLRQGFVVKAAVGATAGAVSNGHEPALTGIGLGRALLFALLGGLILNLMPCVLPVLSLKALALAGHGGAESDRQRAHGLAYLGGVLACFAVLAAVLLALRGMGQALGWGFQFQSPAFVLLLAALFFVLGLNMSGVFSIGGRLAGIGDGLTRTPGLTGSFFTGALASIAATPCTAPFMGAAVGYAVTAPALVCLLVLLAMGLGLALPMLALSFSPGLRRFLPKPGPWMETFKQALAFPLYATAAWLVWVLSLQNGSDGVLAAMVGLVGLGLAAWLIGRPDAPARWQVAAVLVAALSLAAALRLAGSEAAIGPASSASAAADALPATPFTPARLAEVRASGQPAFVNMTAAWCITCKVNERVALSGERIRAAFAAHNIAYLKGDWTRQDPAITRYLQEHGRAGVPLYVLYPSGPGARARVLPQVLTEAGVLEAIASLSQTKD
jgi:thiol:disulfide interchange protein DsbD